MAITSAERTDTEDDAVVRWRFDELVRAGYTWGTALKLARSRGVDLRLAERLLRDGCPAATALRILL